MLTLPMLASELLSLVLTPRLHSGPALSLVSELSSVLASGLASTGTSVLPSTLTLPSRGQAWMLTLPMLVSELLSVLASVLAPQLTSVLTATLTLAPA